LPEDPSDIEIFPVEEIIDIYIIETLQSFPRGSAVAATAAWSYEVLHSMYATSAGLSPSNCTTSRLSWHEIKRDVLWIGTPSRLIILP